MAINNAIDREIIDMFTYVRNDIDVYIFTIHPDYFRSFISYSIIIVNMKYFCNIKKINTVFAELWRLKSSNFVNSFIVQNTIRKI